MGEQEEQRHPHYESIQLAHAAAVIIFALHMAVSLDGFTTVQLWQQALRSGLWGGVAWGLTYFAGVSIGLLFSGEEIGDPRNLFRRQERKETATDVAENEEVEEDDVEWEDFDETVINEPGLDAWAESHIVGRHFRVKTTFHVVPAEVTADDLIALRNAKLDGNLPNVSERKLGGIGSIRRFSEQNKQSAAKAMISFLTATGMINGERKGQVHHWTALGNEVFPGPTLEEPAPPNEDDDLVYFIRQSGFVKIGVSADPEKRIRELQTGNPEPLELLHTEGGGYHREAELHQRFADLWVNGEWFKYEGELFEYIERWRIG